MTNKLRAEFQQRSDAALSSAVDLVNAATGVNNPEAQAAAMSRRNLLVKASLLSIAVPGVAMLLSGCDRNGGKSGAGAPGPQDQAPSGPFHDSATTLDPAILAAAPSAKLERFDPTLPPPPKDGVLKLNWRSTEVPYRIAPNIVVAAWTFEDTVPGPIAHCRVGDTVEFTLTNDTFMPHSMDFHASQLDPEVAFRSISKGQSVTFTFKPRYAGAFLYHCGTAPVLMHIGAGMYGALIVSPREPLPPAKEFVLVQGEYYLGKPHGEVFPIDFGKMLAVAPDMVCFNGRPDQYLRDPIRVKLNDRVRFWVVNAGPTIPSAFHLVGEQFETVYLGEPPGNSIHGVQTFNVPAGGGMVFELVCDVPGSFVFVNHAFGHGQKSAMGNLVVEP